MTTSPQCFAPQYQAIAGDKTVPIALDSRTNKD
jgi:hypothetical protein